MLKFKDEFGNLLTKGYYYSDNWIEITLDGEQFFLKPIYRGFDEFVTSTINGRTRYYKDKDFDSHRILLIEL